MTGTRHSIVYRELQVPTLQWIRALSHADVWRNDLTCNGDFSQPVRSLVKVTGDLTVDESWQDYGRASSGYALPENLGKESPEIWAAFVGFSPLKTPSWRIIICIVTLATYQWLPCDMTYETQSNNARQRSVWWLWYPWLETNLECDLTSKIEKGITKLRVALDATHAVVHTHKMQYLNRDHRPLRKYRLQTQGGTRQSLIVTSFGIKRGKGRINQSSYCQYAE
jgi:hypothetical protein